jgi:DNA-binding NarL/FixJ family response regulator
MITTKSVLIHGHDMQLSTTRQLILEMDGIEVFQSANPAEARDLLIRERPDVMVLCHTVPLAMRDCLLRIASSSQHETKTLVFYDLAPTQRANPNGRVLSSFDSLLVFRLAVRDLLFPGVFINSQLKHDVV